MKRKKDSETNRTKVNYDLKLRDIDSGVEQMRSLLDTLETKINSCPKVDEKGDSECPFAEDLYAQKDQAAEKVEAYLERLEIFLDLLEEELASLQANLSQVETDLRSLNLDSAKEQYLNAQRALELQIQKNRDRKKEILELISLAERMLDQARKKKWPLGKPQERPFPPPLGLGAFSRAGPPFQTELDSLFSLGPIGEKQGLVGPKWKI